MSPFYVIGHKNPDTDAICSALGHAAFLKATGDEPEAIAARCGEIPQRTAWVLEKAGIAPPLLLLDARTTAGMISNREIVQVKPTDTFFTAYNMMLEASIRCVPVVSEDGKVQGILQYINLLKLLLPDNSDALSVRTVHASLNKIAATVEAESLGAPIKNDDEGDLVLLVGASSKETVEKRLDGAIEDKTISRFLVICGDRPSVQRAAIKKGACALLVTGNNEIPPEIIALAIENDTIVLRCHHDTASANTLIRCSRTVVHVMEKDFISLKESQPVSSFSKQLATSNQDLFPVMDTDGETMLGVLVKSDLVDPPSLRFALVDHNEYSQAISGIEEAAITEVIDHHRLSGDITSREPIRYLNEPVGSSCTLVARKFFDRDIEPAPGIALCLCGGIVSDTLCLTSPTTTDLDQEILAKLGKIAGVKPKEFAAEFFKVGSLMATGTPEEIIQSDRKEFNEQGMKLSISQVEELDLHGFDPRREELEAALRTFADLGQYDLTILAVTDISLLKSMILVIGRHEIIEGLPFNRIDENLYLAPGVVSRKRQLFPAVCEAIKHSAVGV